LHSDFAALSIKKEKQKASANIKEPYKKKMKAKKKQQRFHPLCPLYFRASLN
jgi:hypothetical protein